MPVTKDMDDTSIVPDADAEQPIPDNPDLEGDGLSPAMRAAVEELKRGL